MKLPEKDKQLLLEKLGFLKAMSCYCGQKNWIVSDTVFEIREFENGNLVVGGKTTILPLIAVQCQDCGQTILFNAIKLGVVPKDEEKK